MSKSIVDSNLSNLFPYILPVDKITFNEIDISYNENESYSITSYKGFIDVIVSFNFFFISNISCYSLIR
jgi:hypothetical protein